MNGGIETPLVTMGELAAHVPLDVAPAIPASVVINAGETPKPNGGFNFSTNTIAAHIEAKTGPELAICGIAQIELVQGKSSATKTEISAEMKGTTTYYNSKMSSNMSKILANLTKAKRINQIAKDTYSLSASERKQVEAKVAEIG